MIITRTPFRISFIGGGSDFREYYLNYGGSVISASIKKYVYLSMHPYFYDDKFSLKYSHSELVDDVEKIEHKIIKQIFKEYNIKGVDFNSSADIPSGTGLGSSSAFTVGLINLCNAYTQKYMSKEKIAEYACEVEIDKLNEPIGKQDQYASAIGGLNFITFNQDDTVEFEKVLMKNEKCIQLQKNLVMFYLGNTRLAKEILEEQRQNIASDKVMVKNLHKMVRLTKDLKISLLNNNIDIMGKILHDGWMYKKELASGISNGEIDRYYNKALKNGALGGKLLGAGGGGFLLFYVKEENKEKLRRAMKSLKEFKFKFDNTGTTVIYYD